MTSSPPSKTVYFSVPREMAARIGAEAKARGITTSALFLELFRAWEAWDQRTRRTKGGEDSEPGKGTEEIA